MVQIANPSRLTQRISFGTDDGEPTYNAQDMPVPSYKAMWTTLGAPWSLTTSQMIQWQGLNVTNTYIYAVHHRPQSFWADANKAKLNGELYEIINVNPDSSNLPTSYDLITIRKVEKND